MKIKKIYFVLTEQANYNIIELPDGSLCKFNGTPYRKITESDLDPISTPLTKELYLKSIHADAYTSVFERHVMRQYGLEF